MFILQQYLRATTKDRSFPGATVTSRRQLLTMRRRFAAVVYRQCHLSDSAEYVDEQ